MSQFPKERAPSDLISFLFLSLSKSRRQDKSNCKLKAVVAYKQFLLGKTVFTVGNEILFKKRVKQFNESGKGTKLNEHTTPGANEEKHPSAKKIFVAAIRHPSTGNAYATFSRRILFLSCRHRHYPIDVDIFHRHQQSFVEKPIVQQRP